MRNLRYIHEREDWPDFHWQEARVAATLAETRHRQGRLIGRLETLGFVLREEATLVTLTEDVVKTSEIEGESLDTAQVRSSLARRLGLETGALRPVDRDVEGAVEIMLDATRKFNAPLTQERLFGWHAALFPTGRSGMHRITVGAWRKDEEGPMRVVSQATGRTKVHFEAPPQGRLKGEMTRFLKWMNAGPPIDLVLKSALAHFWFVTIHPFDDGNGRIARAIADLLLARSEQSPQRFYSMASQIRRERGSYYKILEDCQKGSLDITPWLDWYFACLQRAMAASEGMLASVLGKARFWKTHAGESFNERQRQMINRLLDGFEGKLTTSKWSVLAKCSQDTALRDMTELLDLKVLKKAEAGGRSTSYELRIPKD